MTSSSAMLVSLSSVASQLDTAGARTQQLVAAGAADHNNQQLVTAGAADHNNQQLVAAGAADNQLDTQQTATWLQLAAWALATLQQSVHGFYGAVRSPAAAATADYPQLCCVRRAAAARPAAPPRRSSGHWAAPSPATSPSSACWGTRSTRRVTRYTRDTLYTILMTRDTH